MGRKILFVCLSIALLLGAAGYILVGLSPIPMQSSQSLDLEEIRRLSLSMDGDLPLRLNVLRLGEGSYPQTLITAGSSLQPNTMTISTFQVVYADYSIVIDTAFSHSDFEKMFPGGSFDNEKYNQLQEAMRRAQNILITHEHADHILGLIRSPYQSEVRPKAILTREQISNPSSDITSDMLEGYSILDYDLYHAFAPGLVLIKAPGHTPGHQIIYLRLQNDEEYLLVGDMVWSEDNLIQVSGRSLLASLVLGENWENHRKQVRMLIDLNQKTDLHLVIFHDNAQLQKHIQDGLLNEGFE